MCSSVASVPPTGGHKQVNLSFLMYVRLVNNVGCCVHGAARWAWPAVKLIPTAVQQNTDMQYMPDTTALEGCGHQQYTSQCGPPEEVLRHVPLRG